MPIVERFLKEQAPDILCLQEIKCQEHQFPFEAFRALGYEHFAIHGQKGYHGVATVGKVPFRDFSKHDWQDNGEARHVGVELTDPQYQGMIVENVYVPAGGDEPDREINPKFGQKLDFLERMTRWADKVDRPTLIVGDFNIAPWTRTAGPISGASTFLPLNAITAGGATARRTGKRTIAGGASTTCGPARNLPGRPRPMPCTRMRAAGRSRRTTSRW